MNFMLQQHRMLWLEPKEGNYFTHDTKSIHHSHFRGKFGILGGNKCFVNLGEENVKIFRPRGKRKLSVRTSEKLGELEE